MTAEDTEVREEGGSPAASRGQGLFVLWLGTAAVIVALDQLSKWAIVKWVPLYDKVAVNSFINITHHQNEGAAFSFLADAGGWQRWFFTILAFVVSAFIVGWLWRIRAAGQRVLGAGLALVLGGAVGNVVDRVRLGHVTDFVQVLIAGWPFPSFNVADAAISVGAVLLIVDALFLSGRSAPASAGDSAAR